MRRSFVFSFSLLVPALLLAIALPRAARASDVSYARIVRLSVVSGDVQVSRPAHPAWEPASMNMPIMQGMAIGTNNGYAEVQFEDGTTAWIAPNTLVQFTELALADGGRITKLTLGQGTMSVLTELRKSDSFSLATGDETISTPKNALFRIDAFHDGASVSVLGGAQIEVASTAGTTQVSKGKTFAFRTKSKGQTQQNVALQPNPKPDTWDKFVVERAQQTQNAAAQSASYVNAPFSYGMADLSQYGSWNYFAGYGYGWQPMGMGSCWMPFMNGNWNFMPGFGWTWVSSEPWGWMPYHFGSWDYLPSNGWTWFPSGFDAWDPAPVNWYSAGNQVGWWPASGAGFGDPSQLMFEQMASGCSGFNGMGFGGFGTDFAAVTGSGSRTPVKKGTPPNGKMPTPPRLMLTTNRLGSGGNVRLFASTAEGKHTAFSAGEPLQNGKASTMFQSRVGAQNVRGASAPARMFAPTVGSVAALRASMTAKAGTMPARAGLATMPLNSRAASMPIRENLRAVNAMPSAPSMPRRPAPMSLARMNEGARAGANGGFNRGGTSAGLSGASSSSFRGSSAGTMARPSGSMPSAPAAAPRSSAPAAGTGRPH